MTCFTQNFLRKSPQNLKRGQHLDGKSYCHTEENNHSRFRRHEKVENAGDCFEGVQIMRKPSEDPRCGEIWDFQELQSAEELRVELADDQEDGFQVKNDAFFKRKIKRLIEKVFGEFVEEEEHLFLVSRKHHDQNATNIIESLEVLERWVLLKKSQEIFSQVVLEFISEPTERNCP